jgi:putative DNA primase/helicase
MATGTTTPQAPQILGPLSGPDGLNLTSMGNSDRFLRDHGGVLRWVEGVGLNSGGTFFYWSGKRWQENNSRATELGQQTTRDLRRLVDLAIKQQGSPREVEGLVKFWKASEADYEVREILSLASRRLVIDRGKFDADPDLLGLKNGTVDLRNGNFRPPRKEDYLTKRTNVTFDAAAQCPAWDKFLVETTQGDRELIRYLQQCVGITLTGHQREHLFFIVVGPAATGKSTFHEALQYMFGDYGVGIDPNSLAAGKAEGGRARPDIAKLAGVRFLFANESRAGLRLDEGLVKSLTGGDTVTARNLYEADFDFRPQFKLWLRTNAEPNFDGSDSGMQRRIRKVPFIHVISEEVKDRDLQGKLRKESAGILNWALRGLQDYQANGLVEPIVVRLETAAYIRSLDIVGQFIAERCETGPGCKVTANALYNEYVIWMQPRGGYAFSTTRFRSDLVGRGFKHGHTRAGSVWNGIKLATTTYESFSAYEPQLEA